MISLKNLTLPILYIQKIILTAIRKFKYKFSFHGNFDEN